MFKKNNSKGFTLIELLIVIIIIGILAAIAFVAYSGAQQKAHKSAAQSTLSEVKNKLGEYNASEGHYPVDQGTFNTWLASADGGNNKDLSTTFTSTNGYGYTATNVDGDSCASDATSCANYTATADATTLKFKGDDLSVNN